MKRFTNFLFILLPASLLLYVTFFQNVQTTQQSSLTMNQSEIGENPQIKTTPPPTTLKVTAENRTTQSQERLNDQEYNIFESKNGIQAHNNANNLRANFSTQGVSIKSNIKDNPTTLLKMQYAGLTRNSNISISNFNPITANSLSFQANQVTLEHDNDVQEWFKNNNEGIEHGYNLNQRLEGSGELKLTVEISKGEVIQNGDSVILKSSDGRSLDYKKLVILDANETFLPAKLIRLAANKLQIQFDDSEAIYPVIVDPILTNTPDTKLMEEGYSQYFGQKVSNAGDVNGDGFDDVIIGNWGNLNAAFVYHGGSNGINSTYATKIDIRIGEGMVWGGPNFYNVSNAGDIDGDGFDDVIVGAPNYTEYEIGGSAIIRSSGPIFIYHGSVNGISGTANIITERIDLDSVSNAGDINGDGYDDLIAGASRYRSDTDRIGAVYIFYGSATGIAQSPNVMIEGNPDYTGFGASVSDAGDVNGDGFDDIIVGTSSSSNADEGISYVYHGGANGVSITANAELNGHSAVSGAGDINGDGYDDVIIGGGFIHYGSESGLINSNSPLLQNVGLSVSAAGDVNADGYDDVIVGAPKKQESETSAAIIYHGSANGININGIRITDSDLIAPGTLESKFGFSVSAAGDVDGDGYDDVIVGDYEHGPMYGSAYPNKDGAAFIYHGDNDTDGDGIGDSKDSFPNNPLETLDTDGDGIGNNADTDDDDDEIPDTSDNNPLKPNAAPSLIFGGFPNATEDRHYDSPLNITDDGDTNGYTVNFSNLPSWVKFDAATDTFYGKPANEDVGTTQSITITVSDGYLESSKNYSLKVVNANDAPTFTGSIAITATVGDVINYDVSGNFIDIDAGDTLSYIAVNLPPEITLSKTGSLSGTATSIGSYAVTLTATDTGGATGDITFNFDINAAPSQKNVNTSTESDSKDGGIASLNAMVSLLFLLFLGFLRLRKYINLFP